MIHADEPKAGIENKDKFAIGCLGDTVLFLVEPKKQVLTENKYCGPWTEVKLTKQKDTFLWESYTVPRFSSTYYEGMGRMKMRKTLNLKTLQHSWESLGVFVSDKCVDACDSVNDPVIYSCKVIDWNYAIERDKELFC